MIQSMTGFGSAEKAYFKVEIRSVNHRFMDISMKIPQHLSQHEISLRNMLKERFPRGKFDVLISTAGDEGIRIIVNKDLARELYDALNILKNELSLSGSIGIDTLAGFRELLLSEHIEYNEESLFNAFNEAMGRLYGMRSKEGETIMEDMSLRLGLIEEMKGEIAMLCPEAVDACKKKFVERLNSIIGEAKYDEVRVFQEAAIIAERADISEEITRLGSHIAQMRKILTDGGTIGRKLEFLLQEMNREANTISSKAGDYRTANLVIEIKSEIEKLREQAQNIQ